MNVQRFNVGDFSCSIISDGIFSYQHPAEILFANAPRAELAKSLADWNVDLPSWDSWDSGYSCLLVETGNERVLVDTGAGSFGPSTGKLLENLAAVDVAPTDIDIVVLTHAHPDHCGGLLDDGGRPVFASARHLISKTEWDFWLNSPDLSSLTVPHEFREMLIGFARKSHDDIYAYTCVWHQFPDLRNTVGV